MNNWLISQATKVASPQVLIWVVVIGVAVIAILSGSLYWTIQAKGEVQAKLEVAKQVAKENAKMVERMQEDIRLRDQLDAAYDATLKRIEGRFDGLRNDIQTAVQQGASEAYLRCRNVAAPAGLIDRLRAGAESPDHPD